MFNKVIFTILTAYMLQNTAFALTHQESNRLNANSVNTALFIPLPDPLIINYATQDLNYLRADIGLRVADRRTAEAVKRHWPQIQNFLMDFFGKQNRINLTDSQKLQKLRQVAVKQIIQILQDESEPSKVEELFFMTFRLD